MNQKFHDFFSKQEIEKILEVATLYNSDVVVANTEKYFFELSADFSDEIEIYFDNQITEGSSLSKEEFLEKLENL